jgi:hypothetical protein
VSLQNRVDPWGQIHAVAERGTMMGNRGGRFHRPDRTLGARRWASMHWICCELHYKTWHHEPMGQGYTSLFFLDEVTALAAGHRPCFMCRNAEAKQFLNGRKVAEFDRQLHKERTTSLTPRCPAQPGLEGGAAGQDVSRFASFAPRHEGIENLPDGAMVEIGGAAVAVHGRHLLRWSFAGYTERLPRTPTLRGKLLTAPSIAAILRGGYQPRWHESANTWDNER